MSGVVTRYLRVCHPLDDQRREGGRYLELPPRFLRWPVREFLYACRTVSVRQV